MVDAVTIRKFDQAACLYDQYVRYEDTIDLIHDSSLAVAYIDGCGCGMLRDGIDSNVADSLLLPIDDLYGNRSRIGLYRSADDAVANC